MSFPCRCDSLSEVRGVILQRLAHHEQAQREPHPLQAGRRLPIRTEPTGILVATFVLALDVVKPRNRVRKEAAWMAKADRDRLYQAMRGQMLLPINWRANALHTPLPGRPFVACIRYSSTEPDSTASWGKVAVDCLQPGGIRHLKQTKRHPQYNRMHTIDRVIRYSGLGIIETDSPKHCDVVEWWEPARRGDGFNVIEVWTGDSHGQRTLNLGDNQAAAPTCGSPEQGQDSG